MLMLPGAWGHSVTVVEMAQLPAGLAAWQRHTMGLYRVCGPVSKLLYALPAHVMGVRVNYPAHYDTDGQVRHEWEVARLCQAQHQQRYNAIYRWSRLLPMIMAVLGGVLICEWSTRLFGHWPGMVSLSLWCWLPPVLAHGALVTSDMMAAVLLLWATRTFWALLLRPAWSRALGAGIALGLAEASKFTLLILTPCWVVLMMGRVIQVLGADREKSQIGEGDGVAPCPARLLSLSVLTLALSVLVIDALYGFQGVGCRLTDWSNGQSSLARDVYRLAQHRSTAWLLQIPLPVPLELISGLDVQLADTERLQSTYLLGRTRLGGWWYWYPVVAVLKLPLPALMILALMLLQLPGVLRDGDLLFWAGLCLLVPAVETALAIAVSTGSGTNAAFRYLLPSLALLCVCAGRAWNARSKSRRLCLFCLLAWLAVDAAIGLPDHLGWQNELAWVWSHGSGQPALIGDSLDWGQDLARLGGWVRRHEPEGNTVVCVYGLGTGEPYGLSPPAALATSTIGDRAAYLAVSANFLYGYQSTISIQIGGSPSSLDDDQRAVLLRRQPHARVGRTICIYRLRDLPPDLVALRPSNRTLSLPWSWHANRLSYPWERIPGEHRHCQALADGRTLGSY